MKKTLLSLLVFYLLISMPVYAQAQIPAEWKPVTDVLVLLFGIPEEWMDTPAEFIGNIIVPFIAIAAIVLGFLRQLRIFGGQEKLQGVIAVSIAFLTGITRLFVYFVGIMLSFLGFWAVGGFAFMFIVGVLFFSWGFWKRGRAGTKIIKSYERSIDNLRKEHVKLAGELANAIAGGKTAEADKLKKRMEDLETKMQKIKVAMKY